MEENILEFFLKTTAQNNSVWLLQADDGLFAMLEGLDDQSYLPVWASEKSAKLAIKDEWLDYSVMEMDLKEWISWLNELSEDGVWIGVAPDENGKIIPFEAEQLLSLIIEIRKSQKPV